MRYFWGLVLVGIGAAYLAASLGFIGYEEISRLWLWWPLLLIFIGIDLLTKKVKFGWMIMIAFTIIAGFVVYDVTYSSNSYLNPNNSYRGEYSVQKSEISVTKEDSTKEAKVEVKTGAVEFDVNGVADKLVEGTLESSIAKPEIKSISAEGSQNVEIATEPEGRRSLWLGGFKNKLRLALTDKVPLSLKVASGASSLDFDLTKYVISKVDIDAGASTIDLRLGEKIKNGAVVTIDAGASTINIVVPKNVGVRVKTDAGLSSKNYSGFTANGDYSENEAYKKSETKIEIEIKAGASTINVQEK